jgi:hypothetical protein
MAISNALVQVRISEGILWIGDDAYPLSNIARVSSKAWVPDKGKIIRKWAWRIFFAGIAMIVGFSANAAAGVLLALILVYVIYKLMDELKTPVLYELMIETAGSPRQALISTDRALVSRLVVEITNAIGNPAYTLAPLTVTNYNLGDNVNMFGGKHNVGIDK